MATLSPSARVPRCTASRHRPGSVIRETGDVARARCRCCGLMLMRLAISRRWIIADELGTTAPVGPSRH